VNWYFNDELVGTGPNYLATKAEEYRVENCKVNRR